jgi:hypothetical protein
MARAAALATLVATALLASTTWAARTCDDGRERTGLSLVVRDGTLVVEEVTPGSAAATIGVRPGDVVLQANGTVARSCAEWGRAVDDARSGGKALLLLVQRGEGEMALAFGRRTWELAPSEAPAVAAAPRGERAPSVAPTGPPSVAPQGPPSAPPPRPAATPEAPPPFPADVAVSVDSVVADLGALVGKTRAGLDDYREAVVASRRGVETLAARKAAPPDTVKALRRVARLHEAAVLGWVGVDQIRERDGIPKRMPVSEAATAPYFSDSPVQSVLDEFDFLQETIESQPKSIRFMGESSGAWRPAAARRLAWEHAGEELGGVTASLAPPF